MEVDMKPLFLVVLFVPSMAFAVATFNQHENAAVSQSHQGISVESLNGGGYLGHENFNSVQKANGGYVSNTTAGDVNGDSPTTTHITEHTSLTHSGYTIS